jgi:hypothetical protein
VLRNVGIQITTAAALPTALANSVTSVTDVGIRYWWNERFALDAGVGLAIKSYSPPVGGSSTGVGFGFAGGVPIALGIYKHITTFFEPGLDFYIIKANSGAETLYIGDVTGSLGFELQLGYVEASRLSLTLRIGAGVNIFADGGTTVTFATGGGNSIEGLFSSALALTFYL